MDYYIDNKSGKTLKSKGTAFKGPVVLVHSYHIRHAFLNVHTQCISSGLWLDPHSRTLWLCICYADVNKCNRESLGQNNQFLPVCTNPMASGSKMVNCHKSTHPTPYSHNISVSGSLFLRHVHIRLLITHPHTCAHTRLIPQCEGLLQPSPHWM